LILIPQHKIRNYTIKKREHSDKKLKLAKGSKASTMVLRTKEASIRSHSPGQLSSSRE